ncbi:hypothetical protein WN51_08732 [Melipona quadrifasciata]|uniref:Uncharacterized protein n=1 Tax=Melipona quadrifasciata TaxID=166423 RepID=A0A0M8ZNL9_9HYME|nr:hypothetical protein WN51_08732 [Melipona quadrifasciata]
MKKRNKENTSKKRNQGTSKSKYGWYKEKRIRLVPYASRCAPSVEVLAISMLTGQLHQQASLGFGKSRVQDGARRVGFPLPSWMILLARASHVFGKVSAIVQSTVEGLVYLEQSPGFSGDTGLLRALKNQ